MKRFRLAARDPDSASLFPAMFGLPAFSCSLPVCGVGLIVLVGVDTGILPLGEVAGGVFGNPGGILGETAWGRYEGW